MKLTDPKKQTRTRKCGDHKITVSQTESKSHNGLNLSIRISNDIAKKIGLLKNQYNTPASDSILSPKRALPWHLSSL